MEYMPNGFESVVMCIVEVDFKVLLLIEVLCDTRCISYTKRKYYLGTSPFHPKELSGRIEIGLRQCRKGIRSCKHAL